MNAHAPIVAEVVDDSATFFAPVSADLIDGLIGQYQSMLGRIHKVAHLFDGDLSGTIHFFIEGNRCQDNSRYSALSAEKIFGRDGAVAALNAHFWKKAMDLTDVYDMMPQKRRDEWNDQIREMKTPEFEENSVRSTLGDLLHSRSKFFAERVDGIFRALSHEHVTNCPQGFSKRMILNYVYTSYGTTNSTQVGQINDLRCIVAKFMGRDEPGWNATESVVRSAMARHGEWMTLDGGAMRIRVYLKGTAHLEIHPEMAWRLNSILANLYPAAIPASFRTAPKSKAKAFAMMQRPLPFAVLGLLGGMKQANDRVKDGYKDRYVPIKNSLAFDYGDRSKFVLTEAEHVLEAIGGVRAKIKHMEYWQFDYDPREVVEDIVASGCIPDYKSHQYYPTPDDLAARAVELADIQPGHQVLEPSAGTGAIAKLFPKEAKPLFIEISKLHCDILEALDLPNVYQMDFLKFANTTNIRFDRVVMNPPFSDGRAKDHVVAAAALLRSGGKLVAILPAGMRGKEIMPGWTASWSAPIDNAFKGTSVSVTILELFAPAS